MNQSCSESGDGGGDAVVLAVYGGEGRGCWLCRCEVHVSECCVITERRGTAVKEGLKEDLLKVVKRKKEERAMVNDRSVVKKVVDITIIIVAVIVKEGKGGDSGEINGKGGAVIRL